MKFGLDQNTITKIQNVFAQFPEIEKAILYGSRAKGNFKEGSDIDITLVGIGANDDTHRKCSQMLDDSNTPYFFDLSILKKLNSLSLMEHIHRVGQVLYERQKVNSKQDSHLS